MKTVLSKLRSAVQQYDMIEAGDRIAVGVSGGKDSMALLAALHEFRRFSLVPFTITAITLDPVFHGKQTDYSPVEQWCAERGVRYVVKRTDIFQVALEAGGQNKPCSLCAKLRRGILHNTALEEGCNVVALGHHRDDAVQTFFMNLLDGGRVDCFSPVTYLSRKNLRMIRPLIFLEERDISGAVRRKGLPVVKSRCPVDGHTERTRMKQLIVELERQYPALRQKIIGAMQKDNIAGWEFRV